MFSGGFSTAAGQQPGGGATNFGFQQAPPNASPFTFGTPAASSTNTLGGGTAASAAPTFGGGGFTGFGTTTPQQQQQQQQPTATPFSFGTPAASTVAPTSAPTFGSVGGGGFAGFGTTTQQQQPAATVAAVTPFSFGLPTAASAPASNVPTFGAAPLSGIATTSAGTTGFGGFGAPSTTPASTGLTLNLGATTTPAFSFGSTVAPPTTTAAPTFGTVGGGGGFGGFGTQSQQPAAAAPATTSTPFSFGLSTAPAASTSAPAFGFGTTTTTTAATGGFSFGNPTTTPASTGLTLNLGATQPQPSAFSFGSTAPTTTNNSFGFNLGGTTVSSTATQPTAGTTTTFAGLGGVQPSGTGGLAGISGLTGSTKPEGRAVLDMPVPPELVQIVEEFKNHMKNQKVKMSEICRANDKNIEKVTEEVEETRLAVSNISNQVQRQVLFSNGLMKDIQDEMKNLDMAMVTKDTPLALQNEITAPTNYFYNLVSNYHARMIAYKREIERAEIALSSLTQSNSFSPQDLVLGLKGTKETVIALAAKVQDLHEHLVNEMAVNRNLKRFPMDGEGGSGRRGAAAGHLHHHGHGGEHFVGPAYDQAYNRLNILFHTPQRSPSSNSFYRPATSSSTPLNNIEGMTSPHQQLFHTASSTILGSPGGALKRTKH